MACLHGVEGPGCAWCEHLGLECRGAGHEEICPQCGGSKTQPNGECRNRFFHNNSIAKGANVSRAQEELTGLLSRLTVQDLLLGMLSIAPNLKMSSNRSRMMHVLYKHTQELDDVPERFRKLFASLSDKTWSEGCFERGGGWSDRVETAMAFLHICDGVGALFPSSGGSYYVLDTQERAEGYLEKYFKNMTDEEKEFLIGLSKEANGEV